MRRTEWLIALLVGSATALGLVTVLLVLRPFDSDREPGPEHPRRHAPAQVQIWIGDLQDGVTGVLAPVWGDPDPDRAYEGSLNEDLGLKGDHALGYCRLLVFNTTDEAQTLRITDRLLEVTGPGGRTVALRSLAGMAERGEVQVPDGLAFTLRFSGTLRHDVQIPPRSMANLVVPFAHPAPLQAASAVQTAKGSMLTARQIPRDDLQRLMQDPSHRHLESLTR